MSGCDVEKLHDLLKPYYQTVQILSRASIGLMNESGSHAYVVDSRECRSLLDAGYPLLRDCIKYALWIVDNGYPGLDFKERNIMDGGQRCYIKGEDIAIIDRHKYLAPDAPICTLEAPS